jgi:hypothetical protein
MTEAEWLACTDPKPMLEFLRSNASARKLRLFAVACCSTVWHLLHKRIRKAVKSGELLADGLTTEEEHRDVVEAWGRVSSRSPPSEWGGEKLATWYLACSVARACLCGSDEALQKLIGESAAAANEAQLLIEFAVQPSGLVRDIFGNPFLPIAVNPRWLTPSVVELASTIYDDRAFERMPALADALEAAGCTNADILNHCRQPGEHARGCWVVDLLLGKS